VLTLESHVVFLSTSAQCPAYLDRDYFAHPDQPQDYRAELQTRRMFTLENPLLPADTQLEDKTLWYYPIQHNQFQPSENINDD